MAITTREIVKTGPINGLVRLDAIQSRIKRADAIIANLMPLELHSTGPGNRNETQAWAKVHKISEIEARRDLVLMPNSARIVGPHTGK